MISAHRIVDVCVAPLVILYLFALTCASFIVIDLTVGSIFLLWSLSKFWPDTLAWVRSKILATWMSIFIAHFEYFSGLKIVMTGDSAREHESALVVSNHTTWTDTIIIYSLARQVHLHGGVKFFAKKPLVFFPVFGLAGVILHVVIFITRDFAQAQQGLSKTFSALTDPRRQLNFWLVSYLEGTRITRDKLKASRAFAKRRDLKPLNHVLQPRTKGFITSVQELRSVTASLYDITIGYRVDKELAPTPSFMKILTTPSLYEERTIHVHQRRIPISQLPKDDGALKKWTYKLYEEKNDLLDGFRKDGKFRGQLLPWKRMSSTYAIGCLLAFWTCFVIIVRMTYYSHPVF